VLIGRPTLYGAALGGRAGALQVLSLLKTEIEREMGLVGCKRIVESRNLVFLRSPPTSTLLEAG